ncbi:hypothetical protein LXR96_004563 [Escherichia coli]|nr:hypothetical protein [Escherichia coli]
MTYEEVTELATVNITYFMDKAKSSEDIYSANLFANAAWGAKIFWRDLVMMMWKNDNNLHGNLMQEINNQDKVFDTLIDRQSVPLLKDKE